MLSSDICPRGSGLAPAASCTSAGLNESRAMSRNESVATTRALKELFLACRMVTLANPPSVCSLVRINPGSISQPVPMLRGVDTINTDLAADACTALKSAIGCGVAVGWGVGLRGKFTGVGVGCGVAVGWGVAVGAGVVVGDGSGVGAGVGSEASVSVILWSISRSTSAVDRPQATVPNSANPTEMLSRIPGLIRAEPNGKSFRLPARLIPSE